MLFEVKERFKLSEKFMDEFAGKQPEWGPLGYITYKRSYARPTENGSEEFWQTLQRVVEGTYTIQLNHCKKFHLPWNARKAQKSAQEMFRRMWDFKMLPPGRGLWMMGTDYIYERGSMPLNNCAAVSTVNIDTEFAYPFVTLMDMSMMGTGCSFDTKGANKINIVSPKVSEETFLIDDSKEGWTSAVELVLNAYFGRGVLKSLDFSAIRPEGSPIKTFGGIAPGPEPLKRCVEELKHVLDKNVGQPITSTTIVDAMNVIGKCVVSGGVRRSAELALGDPEDAEYLDLKNPSNPELSEYRWASNNSILASVGMDYSKHAAQTALNGEPGYFWLENAQNYGRMLDGYNPKSDPYACLTNPCMPAWGKVLTPNGIRTISEIEIGDKIWSSEGWTNVVNKWSTGVKEVWRYNTELGELYLTPNHRVVQNGEKVEIQNAETIDSLDGGTWDIQESAYFSTEEVWDITVDNDSHTFWYYGFNISNCAEQTLEDGEICCLVETFPSRHENLEDYMKTCKYAYIYAKTVTLVPTHNPRVNQIINRNRRMGISQSGIIEAFQRHGRRVHFDWCDKVYKYLRDLDADYSCRWLGIPPSIKLTSVKPSGSVSLLPGVTPGIHYAHSEYYYRTIRLDKTSPLVKAVKKAGYRMEESVYGDNTIVVYFPVHEKNFDRAKDEVSIWEQMENVAQMQNYWADNQISATITFKPEEADQLPKVLEMYETRLKSISFLPLRDHSYAQAPYQTIDEAEFKKASSKLKPLVLGDVHDTDEKFCTNDSCTL